METTVYQFDELNEDAKEKAREWWREGGMDYEWYDAVYEDAKAIGELMGIEIDKIYFSGFSSQGDGACFEGSYAYAKSSVKAVIEYAPQDSELHRIVKALAAIQKLNFYQLTATVKHSGHYYHEFCTNIDAQRADDSFATEGLDELKELLRDFMHWIYRQLETEYDYLNSDEQVDETIRINEYTFTEDGNRF
jgi:hypothetical protein